MRLKEDYSFLSAVNLARISNYLNLEYDYINWEKKNLFSITRRKVSKDFENILFRIDAYFCNRKPTLGAKEDKGIRLQK